METGSPDWGSMNKQRAIHSSCKRDQGARMNSRGSSESLRSAASTSYAQHPFNTSEGVHTSGFVIAGMRPRDLRHHGEARNRQCCDWECDDRKRDDLAWELRYRRVRHGVATH